MHRRLLGKALGAVASYAVTRDVSAARVIFCDARARDNGWMHPFDVAGRVQVSGRGGTVLRPGIDLLLAAPASRRTAPSWSSPTAGSTACGPAGSTRSSSRPARPSRSRRGPVFRFS
jgi:hypothetical protein